MMEIKSVNLVHFASSFSSSFYKNLNISGNTRNGIKEWHQQNNLSIEIVLSSSGVIPNNCVEGNSIRKII